jgi:4a-hydroxytetrahydrobiopterin dehydratase
VNPTRQQCSDAVDPLGWRFVLGALHTHVGVTSLESAIRAAAVAVAAAGRDGDGHLSVDMSEDRVVLKLRDRAHGSVTDLDLAMARRITEALAAEGVVTAPGNADVPPQALEIAVDALDIAAVLPFWRAVTGYVVQPHPDGLDADAVLDPLGRGPTIWFQQMDAPRPHGGLGAPPACGGERSDPGNQPRNRIHLDVSVPPEQAPARIEAALAAGGRLVSADAAPAFWVLADIEGNEACVCTWQGRD